MADTSVKAGYLAKVEISSGNEVLGASSFTYTGETRDIHESTHFSTAGYKINTPMMIAGGEITVSGDFRLNDPSGQDAIKAAFDAGTELRDFRLYVDQSSYYVPDDSILANEETPGSYVVITKSPTNISFDSAGVGTMEFTAQVTGAMALVNATSDVIVQTIGRIQDARISDAVLLGKVLSMGDPSHNSSVNVHFRYGTSKAVLNSNTETISGTSDLGMFGVWESNMLKLAGAATVMYYQAIAAGNQDATRTANGAILSDTIYSNILAQD